MKLRLSFMFLWVLLSPAMASASQPTYGFVHFPQSFEKLPLEGGFTAVYPGGASFITGNVFPPGFKFHYFGETKEEAYVDGNGFLTFTYRPTPSAVNQAFPTGLAPNDLIAPFWDDLVTTGLTTQVLGEAPERILIVEWDGYRAALANRGGTLQMQLRLHEGTSTFEIHYGRINPGPATWTASMGFEDREGKEGYQFPSAATGERCGNGCVPLDWHQHTVFVASRGPDLRVTDIEVPEIGYGGVEMPLAIGVRNLGGKAAEDVQMRLWLSDVPERTAEAIELPAVTVGLSLGPREEETVVVSPRLPLDLEPFESYYVLVELDPFHEISDGMRRGVIDVSPPFAYGEPAPNLYAVHVEVPNEILADDQITVTWTVRNRGNLPAADVPYRLFLSRSPLPAWESTPLELGTIPLLPILGEEHFVTRAPLPPRLEPGLYYVGVELDPAHELVDHDRRDNMAISTFFSIVTDRPLEILTEALPDANLGGLYSMRLMASGGYGDHIWSLVPGSVFPPGMSLAVEVSHLGETATFFRGAPATTGRFDFELEVRSGSHVARQGYRFEVVAPTLPLEITTEVLASAVFGAPYHDRLQGMGGRPPYDWVVTHGELPAGLSLRPDGHLVGMPIEEGVFVFGVRLEDAMGGEAEEELRLEVAPPDALRCANAPLPSQELDAWLSFKLAAAGGASPYQWTTLWTSRIATEVGEEGEVFAAPPPGLHLDPDGHVSGHLREVGAYVWTVEVRDGEGASAACPVFLHAPQDHGLTVVTKQLPAAILGQPYVAALAVGEGDAPYTWKELGRTLHELGLDLDPTGAISGTPRAEALGQAEKQTFTLTMQVTDSKNRVGVGALTLTLAESPVRVAPPEEKSGGCQAGRGAGDSFGMLLAIGALVARRTRNSARARS